MPHMDFFHIKVLSIHKNYVLSSVAKNMQPLKKLHSGPDYNDKTMMAERDSFLYYCFLSSMDPWVINWDFTKKWEWTFTWTIKIAYIFNWNHYIYGGGPVQGCVPSMADRGNNKVHFLGRRCSCKAGAHSFSHLHCSLVSMVDGSTLGIVDDSGHSQWQWHSWWQWHNWW